MPYTEPDVGSSSWGGDNQLFCQTRKGNKVVQERLSSQAVYKTVQRSREGSTCEGDHVARLSVVFWTLGVDLSTSSGLAGHSDTHATKRYNRRGEATRKQAVDTLDVPYVQRKKR
jgi:integrase/recombinase XerC